VYIHKQDGPQLKSLGLFYWHTPTKEIQNTQTDKHTHTHVVTHTDSLPSLRHTHKYPHEALNAATITASTALDISWLKMASPMAG